MTQPDLSVDIGGLSMQNPVMTASGTFGYGREFKDLLDLDRLGAVIVKGLLCPTAFVIISDIGIRFTYGGRCLGCFVSS